MTSITIDTLAIAKELERTGMPRQQAEALANIQKNMVDQAIDTRDLATKKDILELKKDMLEMKNDLTRLFINGMLTLAGLMLASAGAGVALLAWLIPARI